MSEKKAQRERTKNTKAGYLCNQSYNQQTNHPPTSPLLLDSRQPFNPMSLLHSHPPAVTIVVAPYIDDWCHHHLTNFYACNRALADTGPHAYMPKLALLSFLDVNS